MIAGLRFVASATVAVLALVAIALLLTGCAPRPCPRQVGIVCLEGVAVPDAFAREAAAAAAELHHGATVDVRGAPFDCGGGRVCAGVAWDASHVAVVYAPDLGLGPALGSTALEHELCHAAGFWDEAGADTCADLVTARLREVAP